MKTPAQWLDKLTKGDTTRPATVMLTEQDIAWIQADALNWSKQVLADVGVYEHSIRVIAQKSEELDGWIY